MSKSDKRVSRTSFAGRDPELSQDTPVSLKRLRALRQPFDQSRDPLLKKQLVALQKTESQRREETSEGSHMVKLHKPFPELRPKNDNTQIRQTFNQAWLQERRRSILKEFRQQQNNIESSAESQFHHASKEHGINR